MDKSCVFHEKSKRKLVMGALLHDIGKLVQRADDRPTSSSHSDFGARWLESRETVKEYADFAKFHHSPEEYRDISLLAIMHLADWLAAGERLDPEKELAEWEREAVLLSLFSKIALDETGEEATGGFEVWEGRYYELVPASELISPKKLGEMKEMGTTPKYRALLEGLERDLDTIGRNLSANTLLFLLEKYLSFVPSYTKRARNDRRLDPDISLFDHCKLTAAISLCIYLYCADLWGLDMSKWGSDQLEFILGGLEKGDNKGSNEDRDRSLKEEPAFLLADINLSGIQNFIYNITTKKASKSLRARSFYLEMLCEDLAQEVLNRCDLERTNLLFSGGGRVRILAPNLERVKDELRKVEGDGNSFLRRMGGGLSVNITWLELRGTDMVISPETGSKLPSILERLASEAESRKHLRLGEEMANGLDLGPWEPLKEECRVCHVETGDPVSLEEEGEEPLIICPICKGLIEFGGYLRGRPQTIYIQGKDSGDEPPEPRLELPFGWLVWRGRPERLRVALVLGDRWDASSYQSPEHIGFAVPVYKNAFDTFEDMARESVGETRLGVLRMDVDDLGNIFARSIPKGEMSFTRYSVLSRMLNRYFREYLPAVISGDAEGAGSLPLFERPPSKRRAAEIIYSGGDDLFVVGAWSDLLEAAFDIASCFERYTCENPALHISGGLLIHAHDHPIYHLAILAQEEEERAKGLEGKDALCLFKRGAHWEEYRRSFQEVLLPLLTLEEAGKATLKEKNNGGEAAEDKGYFIELPIPKGLLHRLMQIHRIGDGLGGKLNLPMLCYVLARARENLEKVLDEKWAEKKPVWEELEASLKDYVSARTTFSVLCCADLLSRGG